MTTSRAKELAQLIQDQMQEEDESKRKPVTIQPTDWPIIVEGLLQLPEPDNHARLLHRAVLNRDDTMTCHIPILIDTRSAQAHVAAFRLIFRQFAAEFALVAQKPLDEVMQNLIHELHIEKKMPIGEKPQYEGPVIELPPGVRVN
jgi:hypothetical protein